MKEKKNLNFSFISALLVLLVKATHKKVLKGRISAFLILNWV